MQLRERIEAEARVELRSRSIGEEAPGAAGNMRASSSETSSSITAWSSFSFVVKWKLTRPRLTPAASPIAATLVAV
jgi:hypothetical protein